MSDSKGASRRPPKGKTIDLEAKEIKPAESGAHEPPPPEASSSPAGDDIAAAPAAAVDQPDEAPGSFPDETVTASQEAVEAGAPPHDPAAAPGRDAPPALVEKRGAGPLGLLAAAILGGLVAAGGLVGLNASGIVRQVPGLAGPAAGDPAAVAAIEGEIAALRDKVAVLEAAPAAGAGVDPARIDTLESRVGAIESEAASLRETLAAAQQSAGATGGQAQDGALAARLEALEARLAESGTGGGGTDSAVVAQLSGKVDAGLESVNAAVAQAGDKISAVEGRVNALEQTVSQIAGDIEAGAANGKEAARMIAASTLKSAAEEGRPFNDLIAPVEALTGPNPQLDVLKGQAASGLARPAVLLAEFEPAADAILSIDAPRPEGMLEGLLANARSLVKVKPAGPLEGNSNEAIVSRIRAALEAGNLAEALAQWQSLPEAARNASAEWGQRLKTRVEAGAALDGVLSALAQG